MTGGSASTQSTPSPASSATAEDVAKDIAERREYILNVVEVSCPAAVDAGVAVAIVASPLLRIIQHFKGFAAFLEAGNRLFVAGVLVGVILHRELPVGRSDFASRRGAGDFERFVVAAFGRHRSYP